MSVVLIAEDDADIRYVLTRLFTRAGFTVITAPDSATALQTANERRPDVIVTYLDMPAKTGLQLCQAIRANPHLHTVPVGILSGSLLPGDPPTPTHGHAESGSNRSSATS